MIIKKTIEKIYNAYLNILYFVKYKFHSLKTEDIKVKCWKCGKRHTFKKHIIESTHYGWGLALTCRCGARIKIVGEVKKQINNTKYIKITGK